MKLAIAVLASIAVSVPFTAANAAAPKKVAPRLLGVSLQTSGDWLPRVDAYARSVGRMPSVIQTFGDMSDPLLNLRDMRGISARHATPLVTLEPTVWSRSEDPAYALRNIAAGRFDAWFAAAADEAASYGKPFYFRFAPEMNGRWEPWGPGVNGNTAADFVAAWRHVHGIFSAHHAGNAKWVWSPNVLSGAADFAPFYPGSDVVDVLALDGYNWGALDVWQTWTQVFGRSYDELCKLDRVKPVMVAETASASRGGDKARWITSAFEREIPRRTPRVRIVVWFDQNKETDWRVNSSTRSLAAFRAVVGSAGWR